MHSILRILMMALFASSAIAEDNYFPMHVGDEWTSATTSSLEGIVTRDTHTKVDGTVEKNGKRYFRLLTWRDGQPPEDVIIELRRIDEKALYLVDDRDKNPVELTYMKLPLTAGATWRNPVGKLEATYTVIGLESVTIAHNTYGNCYHVRQSIPGLWIQDFWLAPNVGEVKSEIAFKIGLRTGKTLKEFKPGN